MSCTRPHNQVTEPSTWTAAAVSWVPAPQPRPSSKTLHIYLYDGSEPPHAFLATAQTLYGRMQKAAVRIFPEDGVDGNYAARHHITAFQRRVRWMIKTEFVTTDFALRAYNSITGVGSTPTASSVYFAPSFVLEDEDVLFDLSQILIGSYEPTWTISASNGPFQSKGYLPAQERENSPVSAPIQKVGPAGIPTSAPPTAYSRNIEAEERSYSSRAASTAPSLAVPSRSTRNGVDIHRESILLYGQSGIESRNSVRASKAQLNILPGQSYKCPSSKDGYDELSAELATLDLKTPSTQNPRNSIPCTPSRRIVESALSGTRPNSPEPSRSRTPLSAQNQSSQPPSYTVMSSCTAYSNLGGNTTVRLSSGNISMNPQDNETTSSDPSPSLGQYQAFDGRASPLSALSVRHSDTSSQSSHSGSTTSRSTINSTTSTPQNKTNSMNTGNSYKKYRQNRRLYATDPHVGPRSTDWMLSEEALKNREAQDARFAEIVAMGLAKGRTKAGWAQARRPGKRDRDAAKARLQELEEREGERLKAFLREQECPPDAENAP